MQLFFIHVMIVCILSYVFVGWVPSVLDNEGVLWRVQKTFRPFATRQGDLNICRESIIPTYF